MLHLLAAIAGVKDYETPSEELAELLWPETAPLTERAADPELRRAQIAAVALAVGGDFG